MAEIAESQVQQQNEEQGNNILAMALYCLSVFRRNWRWFFLSILICVGLAFLYAKRKPRIYSQSATILISEGDSKSSRSASMTQIRDLSGIQGNDNLKDEIFVLTSRRLMEIVVEKLDLDVSYSVTQRLTPYSLFEDSPVKVKFQDAFKGAVAFDAEIKGSQLVISKFMFAGKEYSLKNKVTFGQTINTPAGRITFNNTQHTRKYNNKIIHISRCSKEDAVTRYRGSLGASENDKEANLITISCHDANRERANMIIGTLLDAYKNDIVESKNSVANNTAKFLDERIALIGSQLKDVETDIVNFKQESKLLDFNMNVNSS